MKKLQAITVALAVLVAPIAANAVSLKCDTQVTTSDGRTTNGQLFIHITQNAFGSSTFRIVQVDQGHLSLLRDTSCFNTYCLATETDTQYGLINASRADFYLRISVDRTNGGYYAEEGTARANLLGLTVWSKAEETGTCSPGDAPEALF